MRSKLARLAVVSAVCVLPTACATTRYTRSGIAALPPGAKGRTGSNASIEVEGLKLRIETLDLAPRGTEIPPLALRLEFQPREIGYSFDPAQVTLRGADGTSFGPQVAEPGYRPLAPGSSYTVAFDVRLTAEMRLELELGGLARGPKRIDPVRVGLARRAGRSYDRLYWLEAIGFVLAAPVAIPGGGAY